MLKRAPALTADKLVQILGAVLGWLWRPLKARSSMR
jgi:hypothetical protein